MAQQADRATPRAGTIRHVMGVEDQPAAGRDGLVEHTIDAGTVEILDDDAAHRVGEGGLECVEVWQAKRLAGFVGELVAAGYDVVGAATRGGRPDAPRGKTPKPVALVLGNEEHGIAPDGIQSSGVP